MNKEQMIRLESPGIFLFGAPTSVTVTTQREVVVILYVPAKKSCGIAYLPHVAHTTEWTGMLDMLLNKIQKDLDIQEPRVYAKVFGAAVASKAALQTAIHWLETQGIEIHARETGGEHARKLVIKCETGMVGVAYHETNPTEVFLTTGTARQRDPVGDVETELLVLTQSPVKRTLAKQAVEEHSRWSASTPKAPLEVLKTNLAKNFPWSVVLFFEDLEDEGLIEAWINTAAKKYPSVQFRWVGIQLPNFAKRLPFVRQLPPLEPLLLPEFKLKLARAVLEHFSTETSDVIRFPKKKAR